MSNKKVTTSSNKENVNNVKYVVLRNGIRVSDDEHESYERAKSEYAHWKRVIEKWPDGSKLEIVEKK